MPVRIKREQSLGVGELLVAERRKLGLQDDLADERDGEEPKDELEEDGADAAQQRAVDVLLAGVEQDVEADDLP